MLGLSISWNKELLNDHTIDSIFTNCVIHYSGWKAVCEHTQAASMPHGCWYLAVFHRGCVFAEVDFTQAAATVYKQ